MIAIKSKLYICPTPLGNLEDISFRVLRVLKEVDLIAAEDTRHTKKLLAHYQVETQLISYHQHSGTKQQDKIVELILQGKDVALVSDAGTPGISDPGQQLISACVQKGIEIDPLPGPCAAVTALSASGFPMASFTYHGFLPRKGLTKAIEALMPIPHPIVLYESPRRILKLLESIDQLMPDRELVLAREISKLHQQILRGKSQQLMELISAQQLDRGEFTIVLGPWEQKTVLPGEDELLTQIDDLVSQGLSVRDAVSRVSQDSGVNRREVYNLVNKKKQDT